MTEEKTFEQELEDSKNQSAPEQIEETTEPDNAEVVATAEVAQEDSAEDLERKRKQEEYRERQRQKRDEAQKTLDQRVEAVTKAVAQPEHTADELEELRVAAREIKTIREMQAHEQKLNYAEIELKELEKPFKEAFTDYDDIVEKAIKFTQLRMVSQGVPEAQAAEHLRREKIMLANEAVKRGVDPVEAVYNEARSIVSTIEAFAAELGYTKGKPKTNLQAAKEIAKPSAFSGGAGKGASAATRTFKELDDDDMDEINGTTLGALGLKR